MTLAGRAEFGKSRRADAARQVEMGPGAGIDLFDRASGQNAEALVATRISRFDIDPVVRYAEEFAGG